MQVGIISVQKNPQDFKTWMRYHVDVGVTWFYICVEETPNLGTDMTNYAKELSDLTGVYVSLYYEDAPKVDRAVEDNFTDILERQSKWVDRMIVKARDDGVSWVFHIDDDELAYPGSVNAVSTWPNILNGVDSFCASVHLKNYEAFSPVIPVSSWATDPGVRYLPQTCARNFAAYANGKSASRTIFGQKARGVHHFGGGKECDLPETLGVILHHEGLAMGANDIPPTRWLEKNVLRAKDDLDKIPFEATHDAIRAVKSGDEVLMKETWLKYRSVTGERFKACSTPMKLDLPTHEYRDKVSSTELGEIRATFLKKYQFE